MLEDNVCQTECLVAACDYDNEACAASLCAPGCYPDMLGDGTCQTACNSEPCVWDSADCECASGCHTSQVGDGVCDLACYVEECEWDVLDCECARGCGYEDLGLSKIECLVPACNFDAWTWTEDSCANSYVMDCDNLCEFIFEECTADMLCGSTSVSLIISYCPWYRIPDDT